MKDVAAGSGFEGLKQSRTAIRECAMPARTKLSSAIWANCTTASVRTWKPQRVQRRGCTGSVQEANNHTIRATSDASPTNLKAQSNPSLMPRRMKTFTSGCSARAMKAVAVFVHCARTLRRVWGRKHGSPLQPHGGTHGHSSVGEEAEVFGPFTLLDAVEGHAQGNQERTVPCKVRGGYKVDLDRLARIADNMKRYRRVTTTATRASLPSWATC